MTVIACHILVLVALFTSSCAYVPSGKSGQEYFAFMQQEPDTSMPTVHHLKRPDSVVRHMKRSKAVIAAHHANNAPQSSTSPADPLAAGTWSKIRGSLWLASRVCVVLAILGIGVAVGFYRFGTSRYQTPRELIDSIPTVSAPAHLQVGTWVKVVGTVAAADEEAPLKSILEGRPCVFSEASAVVPETGVSVARHENACDLMIVCDKGSADLDPVLVQAADAKVLVPKPVLDAMYVRKLMPPDFEDFVKKCPTPGHCGEEGLAYHALQFQERILEVNAHVAIVGVVSVSSTGKLCLVPDTVAHLQKTEGCRRKFRCHMQNVLSSADAQLLSSHVVIFDDKKVEDLTCPEK